MQSRGITPSVVQNTIQNGMSSAGRNGAVRYYDNVNNITVITNPDGKVITTYPGGGAGRGGGGNSGGYGPVRPGGGGGRGQFTE